MERISISKKNYRDVVNQTVTILKNGGAIVYPTDTSYGLGVVAQNTRALALLYKIKGRSPNKPIHVVVSSIAMAKKIVSWNAVANNLAKKYLPGPLSIVLPLKDTKLRSLTAKTNFLGIRLFAHKFIQDVVKQVGPITATSAGLSKEWGGSDAYSIDEVIRQYNGRKHQPALLIDGGRLKKNKPSTMVKIVNNQLEILREGPIKLKLKK